MSENSNINESICCKNNAFSLHLNFISDFSNDKANFVKMFIQKSIKISILILFFYQFYDLIYDYFKYNYTLKFDFDTSSRILPSITICIDKKHDSSDMWKNWVNPYGNRTIICGYQYPGYSYECEVKKVYKRYRHKEICLTFFNLKNNIYDRILRISNSVQFTSLKFRQQKIIIHPPDTASHLELNNLFVSNAGEFILISIRKVTRYTLPKPFSTDCNDYSQNASPFRSESYCIFEHMRREEIKKCGKNLYWNQDLIKYEDQMFNFTDNYNNDCKVKMNYKLLDRICKMDCTNVKYTVFGGLGWSSTWNTLINIPLKRQYNIKQVYEPKLTIINMFANFGGLISMYFGLSVINLIEIAQKILKKIIRMEIILKQTFSIITYSLKLLIYLIMVYQLTIIIILYMESNTTIKIYFTNEMKMTKMAFLIQPFPDIQRNEEYFPEFKQNYDSFRWGYERHAYLEVHLYHLFIQNSTLFAHITRLFEMKIECSIELENNIQLDCGKIKLSRVICTTRIDLSFQIPSDEFINAKNLSNIKRLSVTFFPKNYETYLYNARFTMFFHNSFFMSYLPNYFDHIPIYSQTLNYIIVEPNYYRRLTHFGRKCDPRVKSLFDDSLTDDCIMDCVRKRSIDAFNCFPFSYHLGFIRWKNNIIEEKHICNRTEISNIQQYTLDKYIYECIKECQFDCELILSKVTPSYKNDILSNHSYIQVDIIPKSNLIVQYEEKYTMDGWELIYQLGGVIGMWFGWSAISVSNINLVKSQFTKQYRYLKIMKNKFLSQLNF